VQGGFDWTSLLHAALFGKVQITGQATGEKIKAPRMQVSEGPVEPCSLAPPLIKRSLLVSGARSWFAMHVISSHQRVTEMEAGSLCDPEPGDLRVGRVLQLLRS